METPRQQENRQLEHELCRLLHKLLETSSFFCVHYMPPGDDANDDRGEYYLESWDRHGRKRGGVTSAQALALLAKALGEEPTRECNRCLQELPLSCFPLHKGRQPGFRYAHDRRPTCKACESRRVAGARKRRRAESALEVAADEQDGGGQHHQEEKPAQEHTPPQTGADGS